MRPFDSDFQFEFDSVVLPALRESIAAHPRGYAAPLKDLPCDVNHRGADGLVAGQLDASFVMALVYEGFV